MSDKMIHRETQEQDDQTSGFAMQEACRERNQRFEFKQLRPFISGCIYAKHFSRHF